jgi:uncharacterized protein
MIAPAMKTRPDEPLRYVELARQGARLERSFAGDELPRWTQLVDGDWRVRAAVEFRRDAEGRSWVEAEYESRGDMLCTRCSEVLNHEFSGTLRMCIVGGDAQASQMADEYDVLVASGDTVLLADILEDELLLAVPEQLCDSNSDTKECERLLPRYYPAAGKAQLEEAEQSERKNPFDVLANLKQ